jgi:hypothetical protein
VGDDGRERLGEEFLVAEYGHLTEMFRWNEETGERRVNLILVLMTVVTAAAGVVADSVDVPNATKLRMIAVPILALALLGLVTLARLVRRNVTTDQYKDAMKKIREIVIASVGGPLVGYDPFPEPEVKVKGPQLKRHLGLTLLMSTINSILLAAGTVLAIVPGWATGLAIGVATLVLAWLGQVLLAGWLRGRLDCELRPEHCKLEEEQPEEEHR